MAPRFKIIVVSFAIVSLVLLLFVEDTSAGLSDREPIYISNDENFTPANGVVSGSGTVGDPYIIESWAIDASGSHGIWIRNTTKYFVIRDSLIENGGSNYHGIYLENVTNGRIENVISRWNFYGIYLYSSSNNTITGNAAENSSSYGISLYSSNNNTISSNVAENNRWEGIYLYSSSHNTISSNVAENNRWEGIYLYSSSHNTISGNIVVNNSSYGINLSLSSNNTIFNNIAENNIGYGIRFSDSDNNTLSNNTIENNSSDGIYIYSSNNNTLSGNTIENNFSRGIFLSGSDNNTLSNNTVGNNSTDGVHFYYSSNNILFNNTVQNNQSEGIGLRYSENNTLKNNICKNNQLEGIYLYSSSNNTISSNAVENNSFYGISLSYSANTTISNNTVENNSSYGIRLSFSNNNTLQNNTSNGNERGIFLSASHNNTLTNNVCKKNSTHGIYFVSSENNILQNNTLVDNPSYGIPMISDVAASDITQNSAMITWTTIDNSNSIVEYGTTETYGFTASDAVMVTNHLVNLTMLSANTIYHYRVKSTDPLNNAEISSDYTFTTEEAAVIIKKNTTLTIDPSSFPPLMSGESRTLTAILKDENENLLTNKPITWSEANNRGTFSSTSVTTDNFGRAMVTYIAPTVTENIQVTITASFAGDDNYTASENTVSGTIIPAPISTSLSISPSSFAVGSGENQALEARLLSENGAPLVGRAISWSVISGSVDPPSAMTDSSGRVSVTYRAPFVTFEMSVTITALFAGDATHLASSGTSNGKVLPQEIIRALSSFRENLEKRTTEFEIPFQEDFFQLLDDAFLEERLGGCITIEMVGETHAITKEYQYQEINIEVVEVRAGDNVRVEVSSQAQAGKTILLHVDNHILPISKPWEIDVFCDSQKIRPAIDYEDVLNPTDESIPEYLVLFGTKGTQILVSIPSFSNHTITIVRVRPEIPTQPPVGITTIAGIVFLITSLLLFLISRRVKG